MRADDCYREKMEEDKLECFETMLELYQEEEFGYQKKASMIMDVLRDYLARRHYEDKKKRDAEFRKLQNDLRKEGWGI